MDKMILQGTCNIHMLLNVVPDSFVYGWNFMTEHQVFYLNLM